MASTKFILFFSIVLTTNFIIASTEGQFFCKTSKDNYHICRNCKDIKYDCESPEDCQCANIQIYNSKTETFEGGSDCSTEDEEGKSWCYATALACDDGKKVPEMNIWYKNRIEKSYDACHEDYKVDFDLGNEEVIMGMEITKDTLKGFSTNGTGGEPLSFYFEEYEQCQDECKSRCEFCGAWSFDDIEGVCYLHNLDSCCGQKEKQEPNVNFISGFICPACSSTKHECPCSIIDRKSHCNSAQSSGAHETEYNTAASLLRVDKIDTPADPCACERRTFRRRNISKCRCVKQQCKSDILHPNGTCLDKRRCREKKLNQKRFPPC